jgi:D-lactate dehydrogenase
MKILFYSVKPFEEKYLKAANFKNIEYAHANVPLQLDTVDLAKGYDAICLFTSDDAGEKVLVKLTEIGVKYIVLRSAGYDHIDLQKAKALQIKVANVPNYSPYSIAEHAVTLILALNRKLMVAQKQMQNNNFETDNLIGFDLNGKTVGIIGLGKIGSVFAKIMHGFGCKLLGYDIKKNNSLSEKFNLQNVSLEKLVSESNIISIHINLTESSKYMINKNNIAAMKKEVMIINTSRGACVNTLDIIDALENKSIGSFGSDVYEKEKGIFFYDLSAKKMQDETLQKLLLMPNVIITPHQAFATNEALKNIADSAFYSFNCWQNGSSSDCEI